MSLHDLLDKLTALRDKLQLSPLYPDRKAINGALAGAAAALLLSLGLSASPLAAALVAVLVDAAVTYLSKPTLEDVARRAPTAIVRDDRVKVRRRGRSR